MEISYGMLVKRMSIERIRVLSLNPNYFGKLIQSFLTGYDRHCDFTLLFYVLPIVLYKPSRDKLLTANKRSRMETLFQSQYSLSDNENVKFSGKTSLVGFLKRFEELKQYTKYALIILSNEQKISLDKKIILLTKENYNVYSGQVREMMRASFYLGVIFSKATIENLHYFLGVEEQ